MENQATASTLPPTAELFVKMALSSWDTQYARVNKLFETLTDEQLLTETAPGRNRGIYLLGHLTAVHDGMLPLLGLGEKLHPQLDPFFIRTPDKTKPDLPVAELKGYWKEVNAKLSTAMNQLPAADWFMKHTAVSEEDFAKEPHRNRLNVLINRTNHMSYHLGQLIYLDKKQEA